MKKFLDTKVKDMNAITLIALVITIVVLIILATIAIQISLGQNGILNRARTATEDYKHKANEEQVELAKAGNIESTRDATTAANPAGTIISYYGKTAPTGYLACDGTEYNISDYTALANLIKDTTGSYGTETAGKFKVPNLTGKFLKGNTTENIGNEEEAGLPNITGKIELGGNSAAQALWTTSGAFGRDNYTYTWKTGSDGQGNLYNRISFSAQNSNAIYGRSSTVTPENISVLYCIKY